MVSYPDVLHGHEPLCAEARATGGKGSSLAILAGVPEVKVPDFFCVTTSAFEQVLADAGTRPLIEALQPLSGRALFAQAARLRAHIGASAIRDGLRAAILDGYQALCDRARIPVLAVAVRSSATTEDTEGASFAGQHSTYLNQRGGDDVVAAVQACWASVFNDRAVEYRNRMGVPHEQALVSVVVQKMVQARVAGTGFSIEIGTGYPGIHVAASFGLGEALVSGEVTSDEWLVDTERLHVIKQIRGSKRFRYQMAEDGSGIQMVATAGEDARRLCLATAKVHEIAQRTRAIAAYYRARFGYQHIDTEFAVSHRDTLYFVQARPVVPVIHADLRAVDTREVKPHQVLLRGKYALLGAAHGKIKVVERFGDLVDEKVAIEPDDIVVAVKTSNYWNQYLTRLRGIITTEGSPTAHPILIGRERHLPCVIGCADAIASLRAFDGEWVTLDGLNKCVYLGKQPLIAATAAALDRAFGPVAVEALTSDEESRAFLISFGRAHVDAAGTYWVANPNHYLSPMLRTMVVDSFARRVALVNLARTAPVGADVFYPETLVVDGKVHDRLQPLAETVAAFAGMTLDEAWRFYEGFAASGPAYVAACEAFAAEPVAARWHAYRAAFTDLAAYFWLSWFFRAWLNVEVSRHASALGVSQLHFDRMGDVLQAGIAQEDERLADELRALARALAGDGITRATPEMLAAPRRAQLEQVARRYKVTKSTDIRPGLPLAETLNLALDELADLAADAAGASDALDALEEEFFVEHPAIQRWVKLAILARVQHCNSHHHRLRGQWRVRDALLALARGDDGVLDEELATIEARLAAR